MAEEKKTDQSVIDFAKKKNADAKLSIEQERLAKIDSRRGSTDRFSASCIRPGEVTNINGVISNGI